MSISDFSRVILAYSHAETVQSILYRGSDNAGHSSLNYLFSKEGLEERQVGDVILAPAYRLEEVEEIVEPEKPGVPMEPYPGFSWTNDDGTTRVVFAVNGATIGYVHNAFSKWSVISEDLRRICDIPGYPRTPSTPAVTRKVKKWVKIDHPEVSSDGIA